MGSQIAPKVPVAFSHLLKPRKNSRESSPAIRADYTSRHSFAKRPTIDLLTRTSFGRSFGSVGERIEIVESLITAIAEQRARSNRSIKEEIPQDFRQKLMEWCEIGR